MLRAVVALACLATFQGCRRSEPVPERPPALEVDFLADVNLDPDAAPPEIGEGPLGGISALAFDPSEEHWLALSDARTLSRLYRVDLVWDEGTLRFEPVARIDLVDSDGEPFPPNALDPEGLVLMPSGSLLVSTEPDTRTEPYEQAKLYEFGPDGRFVRAHELPDRLRVEGTPPSEGPRNNAGLEALTLSPSGERLFTAVEAPLLEDGPGASFERPGFSRIFALERREESFEPRAEYVYPLGPLSTPEGFAEPQGAGGLVELLALSDDVLLALERDYIVDGAADQREGVNRARLFRVELEGATDVSGVERLEDAPPGLRAVRKELLLDFDDIVPRLSEGFRVLDNFEALGVGPSLPEGGRSLVVASDDNFRRPQRTAFLLFRMTP